MANITIPDRSAPPAVKPFGIKDITPQQVYTLPSEATVHLVRGGTQPLCQISLYLPGGTAEFGSAYASNFALGQIIEGADGHTREDVADLLDFHGARFATSCIDHYTSMTVTMLSASVQAVLPVLIDCLNHPLYPAEYLHTATQRLAARLRQAQQRNIHQANTAFSQLVMGPHHPLAQDTDPETISALSTADMTRLHTALMAPERAHIMVAGDFDDSVAHLIGEEASRILSLSPGDSPTVEPFAPVAGPVTKVTDAPVDRMQSALVAGIPTIGRDNPDYINLRLAVMALGGYFGSRLMTNIREDKGLAYGISSSLIGQSEGAYMRISVTYDQANTDIVLNEIRHEIAALASNPPTGDELHRLRMHASTQLLETLDTPSDIMSYYATRFTVGTPPDYFMAQQRAINALDSDTIARVASTYLNPDKLLTAIAK